MQLTIPFGYTSHITFTSHFIQWGVATIQVLLKLRLQHIGKGCFEVVELQITFLRIAEGLSASAKKCTKTQESIPVYL